MINQNHSRIIDEQFSDKKTVDGALITKKKKVDGAAILDNVLLISVLSHQRLAVDVSVVLKKLMYTVMSVLCFIFSSRNNNHWPFWSRGGMSSLQRGVSMFRPAQQLGLEWGKLRVIVVPNYFPGTRVKPRMIVVANYSSS